MAADTDVAIHSKDWGLPTPTRDVE
eukprot:gene27151-biopygen17698